MTTLRERILAERNGEFMLDTYMLGNHVCAVTCSPEEAETCVVGESHMDTSEYVCLRQVKLEDEVPDDERILMITRGTWDKSLTENLLKSNLEEYKRQQD